MSAAITSITTTEALQKAKDGSYYFIAGAGGDLAEWVKGYEDMLAEAEIGKPQQWFQTTGAAINLFALHNGDYRVHHRNGFPLDLTCLLFPLDGLNLGKLAIFKIRMEDRWFDDVVQNMRASF